MARYIYSALDGASAAATTDVLIKYTYYRNAHLDGKVDGSDYSRIDNAFVANLAISGCYSGWFNGDFNDDGVINGSDYTLIDNAFNSQRAQVLVQLALPAGDASNGGNNMTKNVN